MFTATKDDNISNLKSSTPSFQDNVDKTANDLQYAANKAGHKVRAFISSAADEISHAGDTVTGQIRSNPLQSSLVALGVGFVLGALFRR
jgi:ElaB/YqjD/DUF883 family membrane-anchored ribosome-binding protein